MLFYINYGCSQSHETLIVDADTFERANDYAEQAAQEVYYSYDCNYPSDEDYESYYEEGLTEEEIADNEYMEMQNDIYWSVEPFDESKDYHMEALHECGSPYEV